jgi:hypothetical protein
VSVSTSGFTFAFGTVSDELNLTKTLGQEGNHSGGLHRAVHEGLDTASDVTWPVSNTASSPALFRATATQYAKNEG